MKKEEKKKEEDKRVDIIILLLVGPKCALRTYHLRMYELLLDFHPLKKEKLCETAGSSADIIN